MSAESLSARTYRAALHMWQADPGRMAKPILTDFEHLDVVTSPASQTSHVDPNLRTALDRVQSDAAAAAQQRAAEPPAAPEPQYGASTVGARPPASRVVVNRRDGTARQEPVPTASLISGRTAVDDALARMQAASGVRFAEPGQ
jgi:hypothetical protein